MITLTDSEVLDLVERAVAEKGADYIYKDPKTGNQAGPKNSENNVACRYVYGGKSSCIVGNVLLRAGVPYESLIDRKRYGTSAREMISKVDVEMSESARSFVSQLQRHQDRGESWGQALKSALEIHPEIQKEA